MIEIIPAIDIIDGKCVRLTQGDFAQKKIYGENPLEIAKQFETCGLKRLHVVDLDGAKTGAIKNLKVLETLAAQTNLRIDFGGGIKTDRDIQAVFDAGAAAASIGSVAVKNAEKFFEWLARYGADKILLGADVNGGRLRIDGWQTRTEIEIVPFLRDYHAKGVAHAFVTDISRDGLLQGSANRLYADILKAVPELKLIASGGVSRIEDIYELDEIGCAGVIVGKAIYEGRINIADLGKLANGEAFASKID